MDKGITTRETMVAEIIIKVAMEVETIKVKAAMVDSIKVKVSKVKAAMVDLIKVKVSKVKATMVDLIKVKVSKAKAIRVTTMVAAGTIAIAEMAETTWSVTSVVEEVMLQTTVGMIQGMLA